VAIVDPLGVEVVPPLPEEHARATHEIAMVSATRSVRFMSAPCCSSRATSRVRAAAAAGLSAVKSP
jgi:hypothetical protein